MKIYTRSAPYGRWINGATLVPTLEEADLLILIGGADVAPHLYGESHIGQYTGLDLESDVEDIQDFNTATKLGIPVLGICRGSQLLCALNGGRIIQHVTNHAGVMHPIITNKNEVYKVNSTHHQMAYPYDLPENEFELIAWAQGLADIYLNGENKPFMDKDLAVPIRKIKEPEVVYYPKTNSLGIQSHPEFHGYPQNTRDYMLSLILNKLFKNKEWNKSPSDPILNLEYQILEEFQNQELD